MHPRSRVATSLRRASARRSRIAMGDPLVDKITFRSLKIRKHHIPETIVISIDIVAGKLLTTVDICAEILFDDNFDSIMNNIPRTCWVLLIETTRSLQE
jgi:hypothetical protein